MSEMPQIPPIYQQPQQAAVGRKRRRWPWIAGIVVAFVLGIAIGNGTGNTSKNAALAAATMSASRTPATPTAPTTVAAPTTTTVVPTPLPVVPTSTHRAVTTRPPAPPAPPTTVAPATPTVLYSKTGSGIGSTPNFTTGAEWQVQYTYDCANFGQQGNFAVTDESDVLVNALAAGGSDTAYVHNSPGTHSLTVNSECNWTIKVIG
jgi:hypothetical protein